VDTAGRVRIQPDLTAPDHPDIFVVGDTASLDQDDKPRPGVAQVAIQQGKYAAQFIFRKDRPSALATISLLRQGESGRCWHEFRSAAERRSSTQWLYGLARMGSHTHSIPGR
jgi:NADH dehydrogenase FAD-containing subunit